MESTGCEADVNAHPDTDWDRHLRAAVPPTQDGSVFPPTRAQQHSLTEAAVHRIKGSIL